MFNDLPLFRNTDPITSELGAADVKPRRRSQQATLLAVYAQFLGGISDEKAGDMSGLSRNPRCCYWKRCSELRAGGFIESTGQFVYSSAGSKQMVCAITDKGRALLESWA